MRIRAKYNRATLGIAAAHKFYSTDNDSDGFGMGAINFWWKYAWDSIIEIYPLNSMLPFLLFIWHNGDECKKESSSNQSQTTDGKHSVPDSEL